MGASGWNYFTPYQPDPEAALQALRQDIFARKAYGKYFSEGAAAGYEQKLEIQPEIYAAMTPELKEAFKNRRPLVSSSPAENQNHSSIEEVLEAAAETGTHSILDIIKTSPIPDFAVAWEADPVMVQEVYGTTRPTHELVEKNEGELSGLLNLERWQAVYLTVYKDGKPAELYFEGVSGD